MVWEDAPCVLGVDPGKTGAVAWINGPHVGGAIVDTGDPSRLVEVLAEPAAALGVSRLLVAIEMVRSRPGEGRPASFSFGASWGCARGVCMGLGLPTVLVPPTQWVALALRGKGRPKERGARKRAILSAARERWPWVELSRVKDQAVADALWIAEWARVNNAIAPRRKAREEEL